MLVFQTHHGGFDLGFVVHEVSEKSDFYLVNHNLKRCKLFCNVFWMRYSKSSVTSRFVCDCGPCCFVIFLYALPVTKHITWRTAHKTCQNMQMVLSWPPACNAGFPVTRIVLNAACKVMPSGRGQKIWCGYYLRSRYQRHWLWHLSTRVRQAQCEFPKILTVTSLPQTVACFLPLFLSSSYNSSRGGSSQHLLTRPPPPVFVALYASIWHAPFQPLLEPRTPGFTVATATKTYNS